MKKIVLLGLLALTACTSLKVVEIDPKTGYFPSDSKADVVTQETYDLDTMKALLLVTSGDFVEGQVRNMHYFDRVMDVDELSSVIVREGLQEKVPSVSDKIGVNKAYTHYKPFLWLRFNLRGSGTQSYGQFILTDPKDMKDIFIAEKHLDYVWAGVNDQSTWYPLCNALIDYIRANSKTYGKPGQSAAPAP